jgi:hypothetical protein
MQDTTSKYWTNESRLIGLLSTGLILERIYDGSTYEYQGVFKEGVFGRWWTLVFKSSEPTPNIDHYPNETLNDLFLKFNNFSINIDRTGFMYRYSYQNFYIITPLKEMPMKTCIKEEYESLDYSSVKISLSLKNMRDYPKYKFYTKEPDVCLSIKHVDFRQTL